MQKMLWLCATKNGTKTDELLEAAGNGHKRIQKNVNANSDLGRRQSSPQTRQGIGRLRDKRKESQGQSIEDCGMNSGREDSWHRKA